MRKILRIIEDIRETFDKIFKNLLTNGNRNYVETWKKSEEISIKVLSKFQNLYERFQET